MDVRNDCYSTGSQAWDTRQMDFGLKNAAHYKKCVTRRVLGDNRVICQDRLIYDGISKEVTIKSDAF